MIHIIVPVKDSVESTERTLRAIVAARPREPHLLRVYDDNSKPENAAHLASLCKELGFELFRLADLTDHPSPNYLFVLRREQKLCLEDAAGLLIVESDVTVRPGTLQGLCDCAQSTPDCGMAAAVTVDAEGKVNYPYGYAAKWKGDVADCKRHLSFCCTLLTQQLLCGFDFNSLDDRKNWFDVTISHASHRLGLKNSLLLTLPVEHRPHQSRPWKLLKKQNPLLYYCRKLTRGLDRI